MKTNEELLQMPKAKLIDRAIKIDKLMNKIWNEAHDRDFIRILSRPTLEQRSKEYLVNEINHAIQKFRDHWKQSTIEEEGSNIYLLYEEKRKTLKPIYDKLKEVRARFEAGINQTVRDVVSNSFSDLLGNGVVDVNKFAVQIQNDSVLIGYLFDNRSISFSSFTYYHMKPWDSDEYQDSYNMGTCGKVILDDNEDTPVWMILAGLTSKIRLLRPHLNKVIEDFEIERKQLDEEAVKIYDTYRDKMSKECDVAFQQALNIEYGRDSFKL